MIEEDKKWTDRILSKDAEAVLDCFNGKTVIPMIIVN